MNSERITTITTLSNLKRTLLFHVFILLIFTPIKAENWKIDGAYEKHDFWNNRSLLVIKDSLVLLSTNDSMDGYSTYGTISDFIKSKKIYKIKFYRSTRSNYNSGRSSHLLISSEMLIRIDSVGKLGRSIKIEEVERDSISGLYKSTVLDNPSIPLEWLKQRKTSATFHRIDKSVGINQRGGFHCTCPRLKNKYKANEIYMVDNVRVNLPTPIGISSIPRTELKVIKRRLKRIASYGKGTTFLVINKGAQNATLKIVFNDTNLDNVTLKTEILNSINWDTILSRRGIDVLFFDIENYEEKLYIHSPITN